MTPAVTAPAGASAPPAADLRWLRAPGIAGAAQPALAEAFGMLRGRLDRSLDQRLDQRQPGAGARLVALCSARRQASTARCAVNLALSLAADAAYDGSAWPQSDLKSDLEPGLNSDPMAAARADSGPGVLLVDADLGAGEVQALLGLGPVPGLAEHLHCGERWDTLLVEPGVPALSVLAAGHCAGFQGSSAPRRGLQQLASEWRGSDRFAWVVVVLPPLLERADALAWLPLVDAALLVVDDDVVARADLAASAELLAPFPLVGSVLAPRPEAAPRRWFWSRRPDDSSAPGGRATGDGIDDEIDQD